MPGVAEVAHIQAKPYTTADAGQCDPPLVVGRDRSRPGADALGRVGREPDALVSALVVHPPDATERDLDTAGRRAGHVDQPDAHGLLGLEPDVGRGLLGVGVQLGPAESVPGRGRQRDHLEDADRRGAGCVEAVPAVGTGLALAEQLVPVDLVAGADPGRAGPAPRGRRPRP